MHFFDPEKAFDLFSREIIWEALRKLGVKEWLVRFLLELMSRNNQSRVGVNGSFSDDLLVQVGLH